jgi:hypothetical protein
MTDRFAQIEIHSCQTLIDCLGWARVYCEGTHDLCADDFAADVLLFWYCSRCTRKLELVLGVDDVFA